MCLSGRPAPEGRANIGTELSQGAIGMSVVVVRRGGLSAVVQANRFDSSHGRKSANCLVDEKEANWNRFILVCI